MRDEINMGTTMDGSTVRDTRKDIGNSQDILIDANLTMDTDNMVGKKGDSGGNNVVATLEKKPVMQKKKLLSKAP